MDAFFKLVAAGPMFFVSAWLLMIFAGITVRLRLRDPPCIERSRSSLQPKQSTPASLRTLVPVIPGRTTADDGSCGPDRRPAVRLASIVKT